MVTVSAEVNPGMTSGVGVVRVVELTVLGFSAKQKGL